MKGLFIAMALFAAIWAASCDEEESWYDCDRVCYRYQACYDTDYDIGRCQSRCRSNTSKARAAECRVCVDSKSCVNATFTCAVQCVGVVP